MPPFVVCPDCSGTGRDASTAYAITGDELDEQVGPDWGDRMDYVRELADLTQKCPTCEGHRVCTPTEAKAWHDDAEYRAEIAAEARYFGYGG